MRIGHFEMVFYVVVVVVVVICVFVINVKFEVCYFF